MTATIPAGLELPATGQLTELQHHLARVCAYFNWDDKTNEQAFLLLAEEVGELAKAMRNVAAFSQETGKPQKTAAEHRQNLAEELADVFSYVLEIASRYDIDLGHAYAGKMTRNFDRSWK